MRTVQTQQNAFSKQDLLLKRPFLEGKQILSVSFYPIWVERQKQKCQSYSSSTSIGVSCLFSFLFIGILALYFKISNDYSTFSKQNVT